MNNLDANAIDTVATAPESPSNVGRWAPWYRGVKPGDAPRPYGTTPAYQRGADWLAGCVTVEDWGCGLGYFRNYIPADRYCGVDGTYSPFVNVIADLVTYRSPSPGTPGLFMRGVIEHERQWRRVLENAVASFTRRMVLVLFTPMVAETQEIGYVEELGVPDIAFAHEDVMAFFDGLTVAWDDIESDTGYGGERIYRIERPLRRPNALRELRGDETTR